LRTLKGKVLDTDAEFDIRMAGESEAIPTGAFQELMQLAVEQGNVTPQEIAQVLGTDPLRIKHQREWKVGE
jgi:hypothetical protein